jgi:hypothetical protein
MSYKIACKRFGVTPTPRQLRKWNRQKGMAHVLMKHFGYDDDPPTPEEIVAFLTKRSLDRMRKTEEAA